MLKKTITYTDFNGEKVTEDFYFNLTKAEMFQMELRTKGGLVEYIDKIVKEEDGDKIIDLFNELILKSYGVKSEDGKRFVKSKEAREAFEFSEAYSELFMELATNPDEAVKFVNAIIPSN